MDGWRIRWEYRQVHRRGTAQQLEGDVEVVINGNSSSWLSILQADARNVDPFTLCPTIKSYWQEISNEADEVLGHHYCVTESRCASVGARKAVCRDG
jgi:hypothetical protein